MDFTAIPDQQLCILHFWATTSNYCDSKYEKFTNVKALGRFQIADLIMGLSLQKEYWKRFMPCKCRGGYHDITNVMIGPDESEFQCKDCDLKLNDVVLNHVEAEVFAKLEDAEKQAHCVEIE